MEYVHEVVRPSMPVLPYDTTAAQWHGQARANLEGKGPSIPFADGQIAAITATKDPAVVTQNVSDFEPFATSEDGIRLENWFPG